MDSTHNSPRQADRQRSVSVELLRVIGALMVIGTHVKLGNLTADGRPAYTNVLISCMVGDGVAIFWFILGFFFFSRVKYSVRLKKLTVRILIPMAVLTVFTFFFHGWIAQGKSLTDSIRHSPQDYLNLLTNGILRWQNAADGAGHLWYLYAYVLVVLLYPALAGVRTAIQKLNRDRLAAAVIFALLVFNDLSFNGFFEFSHHAFNAALGGCVWVLLGDLFYRNRALFENKPVYAISGAIVWIVLNVVRAFWQRHCYLLPDPTEEPLFWYTSFAVISVLSLTVFSFGLSGVIGRPKLNRTITWLGSRTFGIYLIHLLVLNCCYHYGIHDRIREWVHGSAVLYEGTFLLLVFLTSLALTEVWFLVKKVFRLKKR